MPIFPQNVIAVIWDFDKTLIPGYMQRPLFERFDIDPVSFWSSCGSWAVRSTSTTACPSSSVL